MSSAGKGPVFAAILCLLSLPACRRDSGGSLEGSYSTISESEWNILLTLKEGGPAEIGVESWAPGEYETRNTHKTEGRWRSSGNAIVLEYDGIIDRLVFDPELSLATIGYKGGAPGLIQKEAFAEGSLLQNYPLWKLPHRFAEISRSR